MAQRLSDADRHVTWHEARGLAHVSPLLLAILPEARKTPDELARRIRQ